MQQLGSQSLGNPNSTELKEVQTGNVHVAPPCRATGSATIFQLDAYRQLLGGRPPPESRWSRALARASTYLNPSMLNSTFGGVQNYAASAV